MVSDISCDVNGCVLCCLFTLKRILDGFRPIPSTTLRGLKRVCDTHTHTRRSVEFLERSTSIDRPYFDYDPTQGVRDQIQRSGVTMMGVDILPSGSTLSYAMPGTALGFALVCTRPCAVLPSWAVILLA